MSDYEDKQSCRPLITDSIIPPGLSGSASNDIASRKRKEKDHPLVPRKAAMGQYHYQRRELKSAKEKKTPLWM